MEFHMRIIPNEMQASLDAGVTTHCWCWRVTRTDGAVYGFTDHDRDLTVGGVTYLAGAGFGGSDIDARAGFAPGQGGLAGALDHDVLTDVDIEAGLWSVAAVEVWRVDWAKTDSAVKTWIGDIGDIRRQDGRFEAHLLGLTHKLDAMIGRVFAKRCDATLGDARCSVNNSHPNYVQGCNKTYSICRDRFANHLNFRGFPHMVGNDVLQATPESEPVRDGGSRGLGS
jgi:hypothetical protein